VFQIETRDGSARTGVLRCTLGGEPGSGVVKEVKTPCALVLTKRGSLPNVAAELCPLALDDALLQLSVLDFAVFNANDGLKGADVIRRQNAGAHGFCGLQKKPLVLSFRAAGSHDYMFNLGNSKEQISGEMRGQTQRVKTSAEDVVKLQEAMSCEFYEAPSVPVRPHAGNRHLDTSVHRSLHLLDEVISKNAACVGGLLGTIQGGFEKDSRTLSAVETAKRAISGDICGFVISGFGMGESPQQWETAIHCSVSNVPEQFPKFLNGDGSPERVLTAIGLGVDVFDCSYPFEVAEFGLALDLETGCKKNLHDKVFELDKRPLMESCGCYCCRKHTRAYIHHLLQVHEMLGETLLCIHNLHQYSQFLKRARAAVQAGSFSCFQENYRASIRQEALSRN